MPKTVVIVGALDTKGQEFAFVKQLIEGTGLKTLVVDFGVLGEAAFTPDIVPTMRLWVIYVALIGFTIGLGWIGIRGFRSRVLS